MFRLLLRRPKTVKVPANHGLVDIQQVQVTRKHRAILPGKWMGSLIIAYCLLQVFHTHTPNAEKGVSKSKETVTKHENPSNAIPSDHWKKWHAEIVKNGGHKSANPAMEDTLASDSIPLTIPIWFRKRKERLYQPSDPEWKIFADLQKDKKKADELKTFAAKAIFTQLRFPKHAVNLNYIQYTGVNQVVFDVVPPLYRPVTYEVPCMIVTPDSIMFGWRTLSETAGTKLERIFHPVIFARAFYAGFRAFTTATFSISASRMKDSWSSPSDLRVEVSTKGQSTTSESEKPQETSRAPQQGKERKPSGKEGSSDTPKILLESYQLLSWKAHQTRVKSMTYEEALDKARKVFRATFLIHQVAAVQTQTPGTCTLRGRMDCVGKRGKYRLEVVAFYNASENAFIGPPIIKSGIVIPDLTKWDSTDKQKPAPALPSSVPKEQKSDTIPEKRPVQPSSPEEPVRPPPEGKDASK